MPKLEEQFKELQQLPQGTPLLNTDELASILNTTAHATAGGQHHRKQYRNIIMSVLSGISLVGVLAALWLNGGDSPQTNAVSPTSQQQTEQQGEEERRSNQRQMPRKGGEPQASVEEQRKAESTSTQTNNPTTASPSEQLLREQKRAEGARVERAKTGRTGTERHHSSERMLHRPSSTPRIREEIASTPLSSVSSGTFLEREREAAKNIPRNDAWGADIVAEKSLKSLILTAEELEKLGIQKSSSEEGNDVWLIPGEEKIRLRKEHARIWQQAGADISYSTFITKMMWRIVQYGNESSDKPSFEYDTTHYSRVCPVYIVNQMFEYDAASKKGIQTGSARFWNSNSPLLSDKQSQRSDSLLSILASGGIAKFSQEEVSNFYRELDKESALCLKNLIPVELVIGDAKTKKDGEKFSVITVFFVPTPEFVQALPERYRGDIENELTALQDVDMGGSARTACANLRGESYFGVCKMYSKNIERMVVFPSVTSGAASCKITATKAMRVHIGAYYVNGSRAQELVKSVELHKGENDIPIDISNLENGMYIISAESAEGDTVIQRLIRQ